MCRKFTLDFTQESSNFTQESSNFTQEFSNFTQESSNFTQESSNFTQESSNFTQESSNFTQESSWKNSIKFFYTPSEINAENLPLTLHKIQIKSLENKGKNNSKHHKGRQERNVIAFLI